MINQLSDGVRPNVFDLAVPQVKVLKFFVLFKRFTKLLSLRAVDQTASDVKILNLVVRHKYWLQKREVLSSDIIFWEVETLKPIITRESETKMLKPDTVIEILLVGEIFQFILVFHFVLDVFTFINVFKSNPVLW